MYCSDVQLSNKAKLACNKALMNCHTAYKYNLKQILLLILHLNLIFWFISWFGFEDY